MPVPYSAAAQLSGVPTSTLRNRCDLGLAPLFSPHTPGKHRRFAVRDLIGLAVMDEAAARGLSLADAARVTKAALTDLDEYCIRTGSDDPSDVDAVGLRKRVVYLWTSAGGDWRWSVQDDYGWSVAFAHEGIGETDVPRSSISIHVGMIAREVSARIAAFEAARKR